MVKVENKETLRLLTKRFMKINRARNVIAVIAIMLTSLLFTSLFMGSISMILSKRATEIKQFMDSSHAHAQSLSVEDEERLQKTVAQSDQVERYGKGIFLGAGMDEHFGFSVEIRSADQNLAESFNCLPTAGRMPEKEDEIAVSSEVLESLGVKPKLGEEVTITWEVNPLTEEYKTDTFQVCGIWQGDKAVLAQLIWVSEAYAEKYAYPVTQNELENGIYNGGRDICIWYHNLWNCEKKTENLSKSAGFRKAGTGLEINPAYHLMEDDAFSFSSMVILILFVILAGYLIIYNIFHISVKTDIRTYGLLKNVGTTGKQLKRIVRMQAWRLSLQINTKLTGQIMKNRYGKMRKLRIPCGFISLESVKQFLENWNGEGRHALGLNLVREIRLL